MNQSDYEFQPIDFTVNSSTVSATRTTI